MNFGSTTLAAVRRFYEVTRASLRRQRRLRAPGEGLATVATLAGPVLVTNRDGRIEWVSDAARALLVGAGCDEAPRDLASIMHPVDWGALQRDLGRGETHLTGRWRWGRDGAWRTVDGRLLDATENPEFGGLVLAVTDVTDVEEDAGRYRQALKLDTVGLMAAGIAHDFNNLLAAIRLNADLLEQTHKDPVAELAEIQRTVDRGAALCRRLLMIARSGQLDPRAVDLAEAIRGALPMLRSAVSSGVELVVDGVPAGVVVDSVQLEMILLNLAVNASDAMSGAGRLTLSCGSVSVAEGDAQAQDGIPVGEWSVLMVSDTGPGIPPDVMTRMFEPFYTTKPAGKGTGLGLSTVFGIAVAHGGHVRAQSVPGAGATFRVYLPTHVADTEVLPEARASTPTVGSGVVLVAEDDYALRFAIARLFGRSGWHVIEARDGAQAQQLLEERAWDIDLLVTDIEMPRGNGIELVSALSSRRPDVPIIAMSGRPQNALLPLFASEQRRFLSKPFALGDLITAATEVTAIRLGTAAARITPSD